jgi:hypothetical protein
VALSGFLGRCWALALAVNVEGGALVFEYSIRDFFECLNIVEACWFGAFFTQFRGVFEWQKLWAC